MVVVLVGGAGAFAYFKFFRTAPGPESVATTPAASTPAAVSAPGDLAPVVSAMADAAAPTSTPEAPANAGVPQQATKQQASEPQAAAIAEAQPGPPAQVAPVEQAPPPPVDHTLKIASDLVRKGERAYSDGDYEEAVRHARSALDVRAGYAPAETLLRRAYAAQKRVSEQQQREQQRIVAEQQRAEAARAQAAAAAKAPTPDEIYNQRAHSECARGFFGKSCRHKIRVAVCEGVAPGSPGSTVCGDMND